MPSGRRSPVRLLVALGALVAVGAAACGSLDSADPTVSGDPATTEAPADEEEAEEASPIEGHDRSHRRHDDADQVGAAGGRVDARLDRRGDHLTLFVGDSVLVSVADDLAATVDGDLYFDGADCRRLDQAVSGPCGGVPGGVRLDDGVSVIADAIDTLADEGRTPDVVVLTLANNSAVDHDLLDEAMEPLADIDQVWWVNVRIDGFGRTDLNNAVLQEWAATRDRVGIIDWHKASDHANWFRDHVHPNDVGQERLAELISRHLDCGCVP